MYVERKELRKIAYLSVFDFLFESNQFWATMSLINITADSVHAIADGPHGLDARDADLCWNKSDGFVGLYE